MSEKLSRSVGFAALSCAVAVALGAFGAHGLADKVSSKDLDTWKTAAHYHLIHSVALVALSSMDTENKLKIVRLLLWIGIVIFAGSLYTLVLSQQRILGAITPLGGLSLISAWVLLGVQCLKSKN